MREGGVLPENNIWRCAGWVKSDGTVTFADDCACLRVQPGEDYYLLVEHRNHIGALSPTPVNILGGTKFLEWDFTTSDSYKPLPFRQGQKEVEAGKWALYAGNGDQVQVSSSSVPSVNSADQTIWKSDQNDINYKYGDFNLNVSTNSEDETIWKNNQNVSSAVKFYE